MFRVQSRWLKEKTAAHEKMKVASAKPETDENSQAATKTEIASNVFAPTSIADARTAGHSLSQQNLLAITTVKNQTLCGVARCVVGRHQQRERESSLIITFAFFV